MHDLTDPRAFVCWPCRTGRHLRCDVLRGCECAVVGLDDHGRIVLCPGLLPRLRRLLEEDP